MASTQPTTLWTTLTFVQESWQKSTLKYSIKKSFLLGFLNLSTNTFLFFTQPRPFEFPFSVDFSISTGPFDLKIDIYCNRTATKT